MVAKVSTIKRKIRNKQNLGFSERARSSQQGFTSIKGKEKWQ